MTPRQRYGRQMRLAEIAEAGQAKLSAASVMLAAEGFARVVEERYVRGAGMSIAEGTASAAPGPELGLRHASAREVAHGALLALAEVHRALESTGGPS